jgi:hypothetical protein
MKEVWKDIKGYEGLYQISNLGIVKSLVRKVVSVKKKKHMRTTKERILTNVINAQGYYMINLNINGTSKTCKIHRLVAKTFIPNPDNKCCINHIDGDKLNNEVINLEWVTHQENSKHAHKMGLTNNSGSKNGNSKLTEKDVLEIRELYDKGNTTYQKISEIYNVTSAMINDIINRKNWKHI